MTLSPLGQVVRLGMQEINNLQIQLEEIEEEKSSLHGRLEDLAGLEKHCRKQMYGLVSLMDKEATKEDNFQ